MLNVFWTAAWADKKALGRSGRLEALHLALAPACRLMRVLGPVVLAQALLVAGQKTELALGGSIGAQPVGDQHLGREALFS